MRKKMSPGEVVFTVIFGGSLLGSLLGYLFSEITLRQAVVGSLMSFVAAIAIYGLLALLGKERI